MHCNDVFECREDVGDLEHAPLTCILYIQSSKICDVCALCSLVFAREIGFPAQFCRTYCHTDIKL